MVKCYMFYSSVESREKKKKGRGRGRERSRWENTTNDKRKASKKFNKIPLRPVIFDYYLSHKKKAFW